MSFFANMSKAPSHLLSFSAILCLQLVTNSNSPVKNRLYWPLARVCYCIFKIAKLEFLCLHFPLCPGPVNKHVMTHARQTASLSRNHSSAEWCDSNHPWPHGGAMGSDWTERTLRFGRTKKISGILEQGKVMTKRVNKKREGVKSSHKSRKLNRKQEKKRDRKLYPLRGRAGNSDEEGLSCHVLLTRLEENLRKKERLKQREGKVCHKSKTGKCRERKQSKSLAKTKSKTKCSSFAEASGLGDLQPRKRRLASLNAEAVNSLLLERPTDAQPAAKQTKRQEESADGGVSQDPGRSTITGGLKASQETVSKTSTSDKFNLCQSSKLSKKGRRGDESIWMSQECLDAPAPRRLAGLNAAALLKLTSSSATSKHRAKATPSAAITSDSASPAAVSTSSKQHNRVKLHHKGGLQNRKDKKDPLPPSDCTICKKKEDFEPKVEWETGSCTQHLPKPGYQSRSMLAYPLKQVKEEQLETELGPYYCCPPDGSMEYCHRLAYFLGQQPYGDSEDPSLKSAMTPVKPECLVTSPSLTHPHPHTALTLSPHACLCTADHCFSSYYVHIAHPTHTGTNSATITTRPLSFTSPSLCPNPVGGSKLLGQQVTHPSGLAHPTCCNSVSSHCYGDACGIGGYTYRAMPPVTSRGCSFSAGCVGCTHSIKTGEWEMEKPL